MYLPSISRKHFLYNVVNHGDQKIGLEAISELRELFRLEENPREFVSRFVLTFFSEMNAASCFCVKSIAQLSLTHSRQPVYAFCWDHHLKTFSKQMTDKNSQKLSQVWSDFSNRLHPSIQIWCDEREASRISLSQNHEPAYQLQSTY